MATALGIDIGGSGIKGAPVDLDTGQFLSKRHRIETPNPSTPDAVAAVVAEVASSFDLKKRTPIGVTFPAPIVHGIAPSVANLDQGWVGKNVEDVIAEELGRPVFAINDADAAGYAETVYGAARDFRGTVLVTTLGTGIGSVLVVDGKLLRNTEFGHMILPNGQTAEVFASSAVQEREELSMKDYAARLQEVYSHYEAMFYPDLIIVGGGISKKGDEFLPLIKTRAPIIAAELRNSAGIVGAAKLAAEDAKSRKKKK